MSALLRPRLGTAATGLILRTVDRFLMVLHDGMVLGIDATVRYGLKLPATKPLLNSQLNDPSNPYNTRKLAGLPPTPIANPGLASMQAAAHPAKVNYLYFVRKPDLVHHFFTASPSAFAHYLCAHGYGC